MKTSPCFLQQIATCCRFVAAGGFAVLILASPAVASPFTWTGSQNSVWNNPLNWSPQSVPGTGADVIFNSGSADAGGQNLTLNTVTMNGGSVGNIANLAAQSMTVAGSVAATTITTGTLNLNGGTVTGSVQVNTSGTWNGGNLNGGPVQIPTEVTVSIPSGVVVLGTGVHLTNAGTLQMTGGQMQGYQTCVINNTGTWILNGNDNPFLSFYTDNQFNNLGILKKTGGTDPTVLGNGWTFNLNAETRCETGELRFATTTNLPTGATLTGAGTIRSVATLNLTGNPTKTVANLILDGGTLVCTGTAAVTGSLEWASGVVSGSLSIPSGSSLVVTGAGTRQMATNARIDNYGTMTWQATSVIQGFQSATLHNHVGATFNLAADGTPFSKFYDGNIFQNDGLFRKTAGAGTAQMNDWTFHQYGTIQCNSGTIEFRAVTMLHGGSSVSGTSTVLLNGDARIDGAVTESVANFRMTGGGLTCTDPCSLVGRLDWEAGTISGVLGVPSGSLLEVSGAGFKQLTTNAWINVSGIYRWDGPAAVQGFQTSGITILVGGLCDLTADGDPFDNYYAGNELVIEGTLKKSAGLGGATLLNDWTYRNRGTMDCAVSTLEVAGELVFENTSSITGDGQVAIHGNTTHNGTVDITAPATWTGGSWTGGGGVMTGALTWSGGTSSGTWKVGVGGTLKVVAGTAVLKRVNDSAVIEVGGALELQSGTLNGYNNSIIRVLNGGTFRCMGTAEMTDYFSGNHIDIQPGGLLTSLVGSDARIDWAVNNAGSVTTPAGILKCNGGGTSTGLFKSTAPGTLRFTAGTHALGTGAEIRGLGEVIVTGGVLNATAAVPSFVHVDGGTVQGSGESGEFQFRDGSQWTSGYVGGHSSVLAGATLTVSGGVGTRQLNDTALLDIDGRLLWQGPGSIQLYNACQVAVSASGTLELSGDGTVFTPYYTTGHGVSSVGTIRRSSSVGDATLGTATYSSSGHIDAQSGRLVFASNLSLGNGSVVSGSGRLVIAGGTTSLIGTTTVSASTFELGGGTLYAAPAANGKLEGSIIEWTAGSVSGLVTWNGVARTAGGGGRQIGDSSELRNAGILTLAGGGEVQFYNNSTLHNLHGATLQATGQVPLNPYYTSGNLLLNDGTMVLGASPGRMTVNLAFTQTATGRLEIGVAGPSAATPQFDIFNVSGTATLDGTLVANVEGGYNPPNGTTFEILTSSTRVGTFATVLASRFDAAYPLIGDPPHSLNNVVLVAKTSTAADFVTWAGNYGIAPIPDGDPDHDGLVNWVEYAFNSNPKSGAGQPVTSRIEMIGGERWLVIYYRRWSGPITAGITYQAEWSINLTLWSRIRIIDEFDVAAPTVIDSEPRRARILATEPKKFMRLQLGYP